MWSANHMSSFPSVQLPLVVMSSIADRRRSEKPPLPPYISPSGTSPYWNQGAPSQAYPPGTASRPMKSFREALDWAQMTESSWKKKMLGVGKEQGGGVRGQLGLVEARGDRAVAWWRWRRVARCGGVACADDILFCRSKLFPEPGGGEELAQGCAVEDGVLVGEAGEVELAALDVGREEAGPADDWLIFAAAPDLLQEGWRQVSSEAASPCGEW